MQSLPIPHTQILPFSAYRDAQGGAARRAGAPRPVPGEPGLLPFDKPLPPDDGQPLSEVDHGRVIDAAQEAISAALAGDRELCALRRDRVNGLCLRRPMAALLAVREIERILRLDIISRHLMICHKRRQLRRELESLLDTLRDIAG
jgi:hypothetical protein